MAGNKPQITATIKFRGVTIENMTVQELKELRDVLNTLVGEPKVVERVVERHDRIYPYRVNPWGYYTGITWAVSSNNISGLSENYGNARNGLSLGNSMTQYAEPDGEHAHYTISCN